MVDQTRGHVVVPREMGHEFRGKVLEELWETKTRLSEGSDIDEERREQ